MGDPVPSERLVVYVEDLIDLPVERLAFAFKRARREYPYPKLPPVALLRKLAGALPDSDLRPGPEVAWARMPKGDRMESDSVVWTEEESAAYSACRSLLAEGDVIGARMAFKEAYEQAVEVARSEGKGVRWQISAGSDVEHRLTTLARAVAEKRITVKAAMNFVPGERVTEFSRLLPPSESKGLLPGEVAPQLPGLAGVLQRMRMDGSLPEGLDGTAKPVMRKPEDRTDAEVRQLRARALGQAAFLRRLAAEQESK